MTPVTDVQSIAHYNQAFPFQGGRSVIADARVDDVNLSRVVPSGVIDQFSIAQRLIVLARHRPRIEAIIVAHGGPGIWQG